MAAYRGKPASFTLLITIFALITVCLVIGGYLLLSFERESLLRQAKTELQFLGHLKKTQIEQWILERKADAQLIFGNRSLRSDLARLMKNPSSAARERTIDWMKAMAADEPALSVTAYRLDMTPVATVPEGTPPPFVKVEPFRQSVLSGQIVVSDLARTESRDFFYNTYIPILDPANAKQAAGVVLLRINLKEGFFPLIQAWPIPSETAEVIIVRRNENQVLFLNEFRFKGDGSQQVQVPLDSTSIPAVRAILGETGIIEGKDYRHVDVVAYIDKIVGTPWRLIAKIDRSEAMTAYGSSSVLVGVATILAVLLVGSILTVVAVVRDTRERRKMQTELFQKTFLFKQLFENSPIAIALIDEHESVVDTNKAFFEIFGYDQSECLGKRLSDLIVPKDRIEEKAALDLMAQKRETVQKESIRIAKNGLKVECLVHAFPVESDGRNVGSYLLYADLREQKKIERQFLRSQRMESIGVLAGGIAHDLNNVLGPILLSLEYLLRRTTDPLSQEVLSSIEVSATRGAGIVKQILSFARGAEGEHVPLNPRHVIREIHSLARRTFSPSIKLEMSVPKDLRMLRGDPTQLHQVLMNLCLNARDAMPSGGTLAIKAENFDADEAFVRMRPQARKGRYVLISVRDTGAGISQEHLDRIFEPFFTTKERGKGTGLGLSTALGIVKSHEGFIDQVSESGKGSTFRVYFPALDQTHESPTAEERVDTDGRGENIIIVDDEKSIVEIMKSTLEGHGYSVLTASDGAEAVGVFAERQDSIQLAVIDMMMPLLDGPNTIRSMRKINPLIKVLAVSGMQFEEKNLVDQLAVHAFIQKPFTAQQLMKKIRNILDS